MLLQSESSSDVLVAGAGLAGIMAAIKAAECGCSVTLATGAGLFSGSSFYKGTWGFGLVGPEDDDDCDDLARVIKEAGAGMAVPHMVDVFVKGIRPAIAELREIGVKLLNAEEKDQKEFIPCFDEKQRGWNGLVSGSAKEVFGKRLEDLGVEILENCNLLKLVKTGGRVCGAVAAYRGRLRFFGCRALILATGGYGGIFKYHLCPEDVAGMGQAMAIEAGCSLINMEFMQMMPGYISPAFGTVFDEKTFRYTTLRQNDGTLLLPQGEDTKRLLEQRSTHGPFTSRLASCEIDVALYQAFLKDKNGVKVTYSEHMQKDPPEFIKTYFEWLWNAHRLTMSDPVRIGIFSHAANGGILIDENADTHVPGLFACGEVSGGMHGADRLGGLSTANGLVFGMKAGLMAASYTQGAGEPSEYAEFDGRKVPHVPEMMRRLKSMMFDNAMVIRNEYGLKRTLEAVEGMLDFTQQGKPSEDAADVLASQTLKGRLITARCVLTSALMRKESRGPHYREDYPCLKDSENGKIILREQKGSLKAFRVNNEATQTE